MRSMTDEQQKLLDRRKEGFNEVLEQLEPSLVELADHLGISKPKEVMSKLDDVLSELRHVIKPPVKYTELDAHINDREFSDYVLSVFDEWVASGVVKRQTS